jgi:hypothetical protein
LRRASTPDPFRLSSSSPPATDSDLVAGIRHVFNPTLLDAERRV